MHHGGISSSSKRLGFRLLLAASFLLAGLLPVAVPAQETSIETGRIRQVLLDTFDRPDNPLGVDPVVTRGDFAVAGWTQGAMGGRALLRRKDGAWNVILCSGDALKGASKLEQSGVPAAQAKLLAADWAAAERAVEPSRLAHFSRFEGDVFIGGNGSHPSSVHPH